MAAWLVVPPEQPNREGMEQLEALCSQLAQLRASLADLRADHDALVAGLKGRGLVSAAQVRGGRRAAQEGAHAATGLDSLLAHRAVAEGIFAGAGQFGWATSRRVSKAACRGADAVREEKILAVGGLPTTPIDTRHGDVGRFWGTHQIKSNEVFDVESGMWHEGTPMFYAGHRQSSAVLGGFLYIFGGMHPIGKVAARYNPVSEKWQLLPVMPSERLSSRAVAVQHCIYVCGGWEYGQGESSVLRSMDCYNPALGRDKRGAWAQLPDMSAARRDFGAAALRGQVVLCGGCDKVLGDEANISRDLLRSADAFCPRSGTWDHLPPMLSERADATACCWQDRLFVCGGSEVHSKRLHSSIEVYEPASRVWSHFADMLKPRKHCGAAISGGQLYIMGGTIRAGRSVEQGSDSVECVDLDSGESWEVAKMASRKMHFGVGLLALGPSGTPPAAVGAG